MWSLQATVPGVGDPCAKLYRLNEPVSPEKCYLLHPHRVRLKEEVCKLKVLLGHIPGAAVAEGGREGKSRRILFFPFLFTQPSN